MKSIILVLSIIFTATLSCADVPVSDIVAQYNGSDVTGRMIIEEFSSIFASPEMKGKKFVDLDKKLQENLINNYIANRLLDDEVRSSDIKNSKDFKARVNFISETLARNMFLAQATKKSVTQKDVDEQYNKIVKEMQGKKSIAVSHILLGDEKSAKEVKAKLDKGMKFAEAAKQYSKDDATKSSGGSLGLFRPGDLVKEFEDVAYSMKQGQVSDPVKTQYGWHIILLDKIVDIKLPSKKELEESIRANMQNRAQHEYLQELFKKANVQIIVPSQSKK
jgi:foldase protein PrsA